ncbi:hypothetical protein O6H91_06G057800 [Diphasiastrum complanatum]|uniref:Uncharacterized protein n=1 Tax=Diphasiastrum complanatum TaxID=34168 RepID=A0ACC2DDW2_DIPCM|nr:hypothetical protein O6H91_06G057800 [Diphasiastrum complanatum]
MAIMRFESRSCAALMLFLSFWAAVRSVLGREFVVGGQRGWTASLAGSNLNYSSWVLRHRYYVGDKLLFNYQAEMSSVLEVNRQHFDSCDVTSFLASYNDGQTQITLSNPGPHWFISGDASQCQQGQKFGIVVLARTHHHISHIEITPEASPQPSPVPPPIIAMAPTPTSAAPSRTVSAMLLGLLLLGCWFLL